MTDKPKPTIEELEAILADDTELTIQINPDGSISAVEKPTVHSLEELLASVSDARSQPTHY